MKRYVLLIMLSLVVAGAFPQSYQQTNLELNSEIPKDKSLICEASTSIKMLDGLRCRPKKNNSVLFKINRFGVFPPDEGIVGGPSSSDQDGVVGALPGELNVNDVGAAVYSIPIVLPQGIGNMTPQLAVTYNNQAGNGLMGWGWNISGLSSIVRVGRTFYHDGSQSAVNFSNDRFMMDGKRLMLCSGDYGGNGSIYKTEIDEMSKIVSFTDGYTGPARFVVHKKDGTVWEYGGTDDSRVEPQNKNNVVLTWLVNKITDPDGNSIVFNYIENQSTGESYIDRIDYTLNEGAGMQSMFSVNFYYDDRDDIESGYIYENIVQIKKLLKNIVVSNMMTGSVLFRYSFDYHEPGSYSNDYKFMYYRLRNIDLTADGMKLNDTKINWNSSSHYPDKFLSYSLDQTMFNKVPFVGDFNGDGYSDVITVPYKTGNVYYSNVHASVFLNNGDGSFDDDAYCSFTFDKTLEWLYVVDFNGDGLDDVVAYYLNNEENGNWKTAIRVHLNTGDGFTNCGEYFSDRWFVIYPGDFRGNKSVSFFLNYKNTDNGLYYPWIVYCKNNGLMLQPLGEQAYTNIPERIVVEDINGDGKSEIIYLLKGSSIINKLSYSNNIYSFVTLAYDNNINSDDYLFPGDFNGDGYTDFLKYDNRTYWKIVYSDGKKFKTPVPCMNNNLLRLVTLAPQDRYFCSLENLSAPSVTIRTADFDGDGKTDVGVFKNSGGNHFVEIGFKLFKSSANCCDFGEVKRFYFNINYSNQYVHLGNFFGHENVGVLGSVKANPYSSEIPKIVSLNPHSSKYSVEQIIDGLGNSVELKYEYLMPRPSGAFYEFDYQWVNNDIRTIAAPVRALCSSKVYSVNNNPCVTKYSYKNALYHPKGHGMLGFQRSEVKQLINNSITERTILEKDAEAMGDHHVILPQMLTKFNNNQMISREQYSYDKYLCLQNDNVFMPLMTTKKCLFFDFDAPNSILKTKIENVEYQSDASGNNYENIVNVSRSIVGIDDDYSGDLASSCYYRAETEYLFDDDVSDWMIARPKNVRYSTSCGDNDAVGYFEIFEYYGNNPWQMTRKIHLPNTNMNYADPLKVISDYSYDVVGHVVTQTISSPSTKKQKTIVLDFGEEYNYRFPTSKVNENGWEVSFSYDNDYGNSVTALDYNNFETESNADPFMVTSEKVLPDGMKNVKAKRWARGNEHAPKEAMYYYWNKTTGTAEKMSFFSKDGKRLRDVTFGLNGEAIYVDMTYDDKGNVISQTMPYIAGNDKVSFCYVYDNNNRLIEELYPNGMVKNYSYNRFQKTISTTSPDGTSNNVVETDNPVGWRVQTVDIGGNVIKYDYYSDGKLKSAMIGDDTSTKVEYEYDNRRNVVKMKDPSYGEMSYVYNAFDELVEMTTPKDCITSYNYDNMGNVICRVESDAKGQNAVTTQWIYDNKKGKVGMLSSIVYGDSHAVMYDYDDMLRIVGVNEIINGENYATNYSYDEANREKFIEYPSGLTVQKNYSNSGYYKSMIKPDDKTTLWLTDAADASGNITDYQLGNGLETHRKYDVNTGLLNEINTKSENKVYQKLLYSYDGVGNLINRADYSGGVKNESFVYDNFNRLVEIKSNDKVTGTMSYDNYGNIISKSIDNQDVFYDAQYDGSSPYAITKAKIDNESLFELNQNINYTLFDKISQIECGNSSLSIEYGFNHNRIRSLETVNGRSKEKVYAGDCEYVNDNGKNVVYTYLKGPMGVFAVYCSGDKGGASILYVHKDHLESWCLVTDEQGDIVQRTSYDVWGNPRGELLCDRGFAGHEHLSSFGLINMNGRAYDPVLSMMLSPDNFIQNPDFSQNYNRYSYCFNNPLTYSDPSGEWVEWLLYSVFNGVMNTIANAPNIDDFWEGAMAFGAGFVQGCLTEGLSTCSWVLQVVGNVAGTTIKVGTNSFVKQNDGSYDWDNIDKNAFKKDVMYALGSGLATSILNSYIVQPTDTEEGVSLGSMLCADKYNQKLLADATGKITGNLFAGKDLFDGFEITKSNIGDIVPYVKCVIGMMSNGFAFEGSSETLGNIFDTLLNFDFQGLMSKFGSDMNGCYSQLRSLFFKV